MGTELSSGCQNRVSGKPLPKACTSSNSGVRKRFLPVADRDTFTPAKRSSSQGTTFRVRPRVLLDRVSGPQKGREGETSDKLEEVEPACPNLPFQDGRNTHCKRSHPTKRMDDENRSKRRLLGSPDISATSKIPKIGGQPKLSVYLPTIRTAPWIFTKILRPVAAKLRELGIRMVTYLDDILIIGRSP